MEFFRHTLSNGIRIVHIHIPNLVAHCGIIINAGSRDEEPAEHGLAHFIEHMLFKGTKKRKAYHILSRLEDRGGELNAYTTKEETAIHASFLKDDYPVALEILSDILFNSTFPEKEIEKEKDVVMEEINSYKDSPSELIFDDFEELIFKDAPIGHPILGNSDSVRKFNRISIADFREKNYFTDQMVLCSAGNISPARLTRMAEKYLGAVPESSGTDRRIPFTGYQPSRLEIDKGTWQNHCIIGNIAYDLRDKRRIGMYLLNNILGGQGLNSRLNLSLREKNGFAYNVESSYNPYLDTGIFMVYFGTESSTLEKSIAITGKELKKLREVKLGTIQLHRARQQMKGNLARGWENHESLMLAMGKSIIVFDRVETAETLYRKIDEISAQELMDTANEVFNPDKISTLIYR
ncbi:MAG: insulinase family protein [Bacteroidales bacterium]|nr:insulinase family protein [Bacteroidales bacterium]